MAATIEELRKENPDLANALMAEAKAAASADRAGSAEAEKDKLRERGIYLSQLFD